MKMLAIEWERSKLKLIYKLMFSFYCLKMAGSFKSIRHDVNGKIYFFTELVEIILMDVV